MPCLELFFLEVRIRIPIKTFCRVSLNAAQEPRINFFHIIVIDPLAVAGLDQVKNDYACMVHA